MNGRSVFIWVAASTAFLLGGCPATHQPGVAVDGGTSDKSCVTLKTLSIDFGHVVVNTMATGSFAVANSCEFGVEVTVGQLQGSDPSLFHLDPPAGTVISLGGYETRVLAVAYLPFLASQFQSQAYFSVLLCEGGTGCATRVSLQGLGVATGLCVDPVRLDCGFVPPTRVVTRLVSLCSCANETVHLTADPVVLNRTSAGTTAAGPFQRGPGFPTGATSIAPGQCVQVPVTFAPPTADAFSGELDVATDDPGSSVLTVPLGGIGGGAILSCSPPALDFGLNAAGSSSMLEIVCTNTGTDVPGHPEANLFIPDPTSSDEGLTIQNGTPAFGAAFAQPFPDTGLPAGFSWTIDVVYSPAAAGTDADILVIASNDAVSPNTGIPLSGSAKVLPPCDYQIDPPDGLSFGDLDKGRAATLSFVITNNGADECLVNALRISPDSSPAFSLPDYPTGMAPTSLTIAPAASLEIAVRFAPTTSQASLAGRVSFTLYDPAKPSPGLNLSGSSMSGCLLITPSQLDMGTVGIDGASGQWCQSNPQTITLRNICQMEDIVVTSIAAIQPPTQQGTSEPEFILSEDPAPVTIGSACSACPSAPTTISFQVSFAPSLEGKRIGGVKISTTDLADPYLFPLVAVADRALQRTDQFVGHSEAVDVLWVVDTDDDGHAEQAVIGELDDFLAYPLQNGIDFQMAVTSTDVYGQDGSEDGSIEPCPHCKLMGDAPRVVKASEGQQAAGALAGLLNLGAVPFNPPVGSQFTKDDLFLESASEALSMIDPGRYNQPFYRPDAFLAVIVVNNDAQDDQSPHGFKFYYDAFIDVKGAGVPNKFSLSYVCNYCLSFGRQWIQQMVQVTHGVEADLSSTGTPSWKESLAALWPQLETQLLSYPLSGTPDPTTLQVTDNGVVVPAWQNGLPNWTYDASANAIRFAQPAFPLPGDAVQIGYTVACPQ